MVVNWIKKLLGLRRKETKEAQECPAVTEKEVTKKHTKKTAKRPTKKGKAKRPTKKTAKKGKAKKKPN